MFLPELIKIRPITVPIHATISIPGSKSLTNRSLILAALHEGATQLRGALWAGDTELMVGALRNLGFKIDVTPDPSNPCNRFITVIGAGGRIPATTADLDVGAAGTVARFLTALCALGKGPYRLHGTPRMHERPMKELFDAIKDLGGKVQDVAGHLPATIEGPLRLKKEISISEDETSQFASALLLVSKIAGITVRDPPSPSPYVTMTRLLLDEWKTHAAIREIEADASSASYFLALRRILGGSISISRWFSAKSFQQDRVMDEDRFWQPLQQDRPGQVPPQLSRKKDLGDAVLTLVAGAAALKSSLRLVEASHLREQECDRLSAMATELNKCGVPTGEQPDGLLLQPAANFKRATIHTYKDHRIAMCFAMLGCVDAMGDGKPWLDIENPACVNKTFPNFFETLEDVARQSYQKAEKIFSPIVLTANGNPVF